MLLLVLYRIRNQNAIIEQACRTVAESEDIGAETVEELKRNREKIEEIREKVRPSIAGKTISALIHKSSITATAGVRIESSLPQWTMQTRSLSPCGSDTRHGVCSDRASCDEACHQRQHNVCNIQIRLTHSLRA